MSRILIITNRLIVGGPSVHLRHIVKHFSKKHKLLLVFGEASKGELSMEEEFKQFGVKMIKISSFRRSFNPIQDIKFAGELKRIIKDFKPDIVHTHTSKPGYVGRYIAAKYSVKRIIHTYHGLIFKEYFSKVYSSIVVNMDRALAKKTDFIVSLSKLQKNEIVDTYKIGNYDKVKIIPLAISKTKDSYNTKLAKSYRQKWNIEDDTMLIAQVGRLADVKDNSLMIERYCNVRKNSKNKSVLFIVGDGELKSHLIELAQSLHLKVAIGEPVDGADVVFTSWCKNLDELYSAMDLLVLTSKSEGTPFSIIEAQVSGTAVFVPNIGGIGDMVKENETAYLYNSIDEFERKLTLLINDRSLVNKMGENAAIFAAKKYNMEDMLASYEELYKI
jgi:glycosyltransferase involved in cell wall biosynthesis